ncbi:histone-fold-containing protein [Hyaloraphidium curvatum]|nr:histone-fold-containing protein [Hyaloraphidium curvatum]
MSGRKRGGKEPEPSKDVDETDGSPRTRPAARKGKVTIPTATPVSVSKLAPDAADDEEWAPKSEDDGADDDYDASDASASSGPPRRQRRDRSGSASAVASEEDDGKDVKEHDRFLPDANVSRIIKSVLPETAKIAKDAKDSILECASEFISFITSEAAEHCLSEDRKALTGEDVLWAMGQLGFDDYEAVMETFLDNLKQSGPGDRSNKGRSRRPASSAVKQEPEPNDASGGEVGENGSAD